MRLASVVLEKTPRQAMAQAQQRYRVIEKIAAGGMAEVYRAESAGLEGFKKTVAIKRVLPHLSQKREFIGMFLDEARLSANLSHSNVVQVFDIGVGDETYFIVMEYVDGANLKSIVEHHSKRGQPLPIETCCLVAVRMCEGLAYAHEVRDAKGEPLGIVHRDVSPPNVLISRHGEVKVVDFGLAKAKSQLEESQPGIIKGKFSYLSPEAAEGKQADQRTDIFAAGIILWEMLTSKRLFLGETDLATVRQVQKAEVPQLAAVMGDVPPGLQTVLDRALARDRDARYRSAREFGRDLNRVLYAMGRPVSSFDIAAVVGEVVQDTPNGRGSRPRQQTLIGTLIQDAMMSFTSLQHEGKGAGQAAKTQSGVGAVPLNFSFGAGDALAHARSEYASQISFSAMEGGNLETLEEGAATEGRRELSSMLRGREHESEPTADEGPGYDRSVLTPGHSGASARPQPLDAEGKPRASGESPRTGSGLSDNSYRSPSASPAGTGARAPRAYWMVLAALLCIVVLLVAVMLVR